MLDERRKKQTRWVTELGGGIAIGAGLGVALDNFALGMAIGLAIGAAHYARSQRDEDSKPPEEGM
jgi:F0F1-type ATP synthase membrane subunit c/vacuolar-type H+-ATPase subunit K